MHRLRVPPAELDGGVCFCWRMNPISAAAGIPGKRSTGGGRTCTGTHACVHAFLSMGRRCESRPSEHMAVTARHRPPCEGRGELGFRQRLSRADGLMLIDIERVTASQAAA